MKICKKCKLSKSLDDYGKASSTKDGLQTRCKSCIVEDRKRWNSSESAKEKRKQWWIENGKETRERLNRFYYTLDGQITEYKRGARRRNLQFNLSKEECSVFYNTNCYYCGDKFNFLGIDRKDNNIGYIIENCVPCCTRCNKLKSSYHIDTFLEIINKISKNTSNKNPSH